MSRVKDKVCGIYKITSPSGRVYIGQSVDIYSTFNFRYKNGNCKSQRRMYNSIKKYGWSAHRTEIIHICDEGALNEMEIYYSQLFDSTNKDTGLNIRECGGSKGRISEETKKIMSEVQKNRFKNNPEAREQLSRINKGRKFSEELKLKLSMAAIGRNHSEESKVKVSKSLIGNKRNLGKKWTEERRITMSILNTGKKMSNEAIEKTRQANIGRKTSEVTKRKLSEHFKGKKRPKEVVEKNCKIVLNIQTGIFYVGAKEVSEQMGVSELTASRRLNGYLRNYTSFIYV